MLTDETAKNQKVLQRLRAKRFVLDMIVKKKEKLSPYRKQKVFCTMPPKNLIIKKNGR